MFIKSNFHGINIEWVSSHFSPNRYLYLEKFSENLLYGKQAEDNCFVFFWCHCKKASLHILPIAIIEFRQHHYQ